MMRCAYLYFAVSPKAKQNAQHFLFLIFLSLKRSQSPVTRGASRIWAMCWVCSVSLDDDNLTIAADIETVSVANEAHYQGVGGP